MKRMPRLLMGVLALVGTGLAQAGDNYNVVKIKTWDKEVTYAVMTDADLQKVLADQQKQASHVSKAADLAKAAWQNDDATRGKPFPQKVLALPLYTKVGTFNDKEKAEDKCARSLERQSEEKAAERKSAGKRKAKVDPREAASEFRQSSARILFEAKLSEVIAQATKPADPKPAGGDEAAPKAK